MFFDSIDFAFFLPVVFAIYWILRREGTQIQNLFLLASSYVFYGWWDWRFLGLIMASTLIDFYVGLNLQKTERPNIRKRILILSLLGNLGMLGFFKYYDFFLDNFETAFSWLGQPIHVDRLNIILPVGISFYTFQTLSYTLDIYANRIKATKNIISFAAFVSFFPQLVAGPIERASNLLPQFSKKRTFNETQARDGLRQILWGIFKKLVVSDSIAVFVNDIFSNYPEYSSSTLLLAACFFTVQVYADFSAYSDIAIGTARLFGFNLMQNFAFPLFSRDVGELWRRWHISLTTWFRDYLYIPLGGSRNGKARQILNTFIIFLVCAFWHGPRWGYLMWGFLNALYFVPLLIYKLNRKNIEPIPRTRFLPPFRTIASIGITFLLFSISNVFLWGLDIVESTKFILSISDISLLNMPEDFPRIGFGMTFLMLFVEWKQRDKKHGLELSYLRIPRTFRWIIYSLIILSIIWFGGNPQEFFYFQF